MQTNDFTKSAHQSRAEKVCRKFKKLLRLINWWGELFNILGWAEDSIIYSSLFVKLKTKKVNHWPHPENTKEVSPMTFGPKLQVSI